MGKTILTLALCALAMLSLQSCKKPPTWLTNDGAVWATSYHIVYEGDRDMLDSISDIFRRVEASLSPFNDNSLVSRINRNESTATDPMLREVFDISQRVCSISSGAFDPTVSPAVNLWRFGYTGNPHTDSIIPPSAAQIDSVRAFVGIRDCRILPDGTIRKKDPGTTFNFSAVTKGYGCDLIAQMLRRNGISNFLIEIGGEIVVDGHSPHGTDWRVQVDTPQYSDTHEALTTIPLTSGAIATSGNYRNWHATSSGRVGHTIDPATCLPAAGDILSATVMAPTCAEADAFATAAMAAGSEHKAVKMLSDNRLRGIIVVADSASATGMKVVRVDMTQEKHQ